jgi:TetR/AcrR family tetracycline transcriptional repressor
MPMPSALQTSPAPLTADRIVTEALALMQEQGLEALSLRRLAGRLGVQAMSLYWHIRNKEDLLRLMGQKLFSDAMAGMGDQQTWQDWGRAYGHRLWALYHSTRDAARLTFALGHSEADFRSFAQDMAAQLAHYGLDAQQAVLLHSSVQALVIGWAGFDSSYGDKLGKLIPLQPAMTSSLDALLRGLVDRMEQS